MELVVFRVPLKFGATSIHRQRKFQQKIFAALIIKYFMWIVWKQDVVKVNFFL